MLVIFRRNKPSTADILSSFLCTSQLEDLLLSWIRDFHKASKTKTMKFNIGFFLIIFLGSLCVMSCNSTYQVVNSQSQVTNLKQDGCLFVRLHYFPNKIEKLNELGYKKAAVAEQEKIATKNKSLMAAFKENWDFSPVHFIFPEESLKIKEENFADINFLNEDLVIDPNLKCDCDYALVVEEGQMTTDTTKYFAGNTLILDENGYNRIDRYYTDSSQRIQGLIVKSNEFVQLHKPFPFYARRYKFFFERSDEAMVKELNERFVAYYKHINE